MNQIHLVSFLELDGIASVQIGAGMASDVLQRQGSSPYLRIMLRESRSRRFEIRARLGTTLVKEDSFEDVNQVDPMLSKGACIEMLNLLPDLASAFHRYGDTLLDNFGDFWAVRWFRICLQPRLQINAVDADVAWSILGHTSRATTVVVMQFGGMRAEFAELMKSFAIFRRPSAAT